jgi:hypothetical protein
MFWNFTLNSTSLSAPPPGKTFAATESTFTWEDGVYVNEPTPDGGCAVVTDVVELAVEVVVAVVEESAEELREVT